MRLRASFAILCTALLAGCYWEPERTEVLVETVPPGAACVVSQLGRPIATAAPTPAIALVDLSAAEIAVSCRRSGFEDAVATLPGPPASYIPGWAPGRSAEIRHEVRVELPLVPKPAGVP